MNRIFLVRHGENKANITKEFSHRKIDYSLTPKGILQAEQTATFFLDTEVHAIYASPLKRALETAEIIARARGAKVKVIEEFRETNVGRLEHEPPSEQNWRLHDDILRAWWEGDHEARFPEGESYSELLARVRRGYEKILRAKQGKTLVIVAHGGSLALPLKELCLEIDREALRHAAHHNCSVSELKASLSREELRLELIRWAACDHLFDEAADFVLGSPLPGELRDR